MLSTYGKEKKNQPHSKASGERKRWVGRHEERVEKIGFMEKEKIEKRLDSIKQQKVISHNVVKQKINQHLKHFHFLNTIDPRAEWVRPANND